MTSPYERLGVGEHATDAEIKQAYLQRVKENPPDRDPQRFQAIQQAYEAIKDEECRLRYALFHLPESDFESLLDKAFHQDKPLKAIPAKEFYSWLTSVAIDKSLANAATHTSR